MGRTRTEEARDLSAKVFQVCDQMRQDFERLADSFGLTPLQARTLLAIRGPSPMRSLAEGMACDASNVTGLADRLERMGLIERVPDPTDRRVKLLSLTDRGHTLRSELDVRLGKGSTVTARLTEGERATLNSLLDKLLYR